MIEQTTKNITFEGEVYEGVPRWIKWVARDSDGTVYGYEFPPVVGYYDGRIFSKYHGMVKFLGTSTSKGKWWDSATRVKAIDTGIS